MAHSNAGSKGFFILFSSANNLKNRIAVNGDVLEKKKFIKGRKPRYVVLMNINYNHQRSSETSSVC
jgi:hypothetical protein